MRYVILFVLLAYGMVGLSCKKRFITDSDAEIKFSMRQQNFGKSAEELLRSHPFSSLQIELQYMEGYRPDEHALENMLGFLRAHLNKPDGIFLSLRKIKPAADSVLNNQQVDSVRRANIRHITSNNRIVIYILYTNGYFEKNYVLGHAYKHTSIVIYGKAIKQYEKVFSFPSQNTIETSLLLHEWGHLLGLVNKGTPMTLEHEDSRHEAHCENEHCVMFWHMSVQPKFGPLPTRNTPAFDSACLADLKAHGGL